MTLHPVLHWFEFICPFCYIAQDRNRILRAHHITVIDLPMQIHPEIGAGGAPAPPRTSPNYEHLAEEAHEAGLELNWSRRIPYFRVALAAAETVRLYRPESHQAFNAGIFHAYFALGKDIEDWAVIAEGAGVAAFVLNQTTSWAAEVELRDAERPASAHHVPGTPSWLADDQLIVGLRSRAFFSTLGRTLRGADDHDVSNLERTA
jgi:predicted DsbA family dithiol-disulfide isomerase